MAKEQEPCKKLLDEFIFIVNEILFNVQEEIKYTKRSNQKITLFNMLDTLSDALEVKIWNYIQRSRFKDYYYKEEKIFSGQVLINTRIGQDSFLDKFLYNGRFSLAKVPILYNSLIISTYKIRKRKRVTIWLLLKFPGLP